VLGPRRGEANGFEISLDAELPQWQWWFSLVRSSAEDLYSGRSVRRSWDEAWAGKGGAIWTGARWTASVGVTIHSGWPITLLQLVDGQLVAGDLNAQDLRTFRTIDVRASRRLQLERSSLEFFVEFNNLLDYDNPCCVEYSLATNALGMAESLRLDEDSWLPAIPSLGFRWIF